jgi:predicted nucleotidyltransferase
MNYEDMTLEQLDAELDRLDAERLAAKERGRQIMEVRNRRIADENAAPHGLTGEQYAEAKKQAAEREVPLLAVLGEARREVARQLQAARPGVARVAAKGKGA